MNVVPLSRCCAVTDRFYVATGVELDQLVEEVLLLLLLQLLKTTTNPSYRPTPELSHPPPCRSVSVCLFQPSSYQGGQRVSVCLELRALALARDALAKELQSIRGAAAGEDGCERGKRVLLLGCGVGVARLIVTILFLLLQRASFSPRWWQIKSRCMKL